MVTASAGSRLAEMSLAVASMKQPMKNEDETETSGEMLLKTTTFNLTQSDCRLSDDDYRHCGTHISAIPHLLHQTSDDVMVSTQVNRTVHSTSLYCRHSSFC